jgi:hypothetical protein
LYPAINDGGMGTGYSHGMAVNMADIGKIDGTGTIPRPLVNSSVGSGIANIDAAAGIYHWSCVGDPAIAAIPNDAKLIGWQNWIWMANAGGANIVIQNNWYGPGVQWDQQGNDVHHNHTVVPTYAYKRGKLRTKNVDGGILTKASLPSIGTAIRRDGTTPIGINVPEAGADVFYKLAGVVTVDPVANVQTTRPEVTWQYLQEDGDFQDRFQVKVFTQAQFSAGGFNPATSTPVYDSGIVSGSDDGFALPFDLLNGTTYRFYIRAAALVLSAPHYSGWANSANFTINLIGGTTSAPSLSVRGDAQWHRNRLTYSGVVPGAFLWIEYSIDEGVTWHTVRAANGASVQPPGIDYVDHYEVPPDIRVQYRGRNILIVGANYLTSPPGAVVGSTLYSDIFHLIDPADPIGGSARAFKVTAYTEDTKSREGVLPLMGRRNPVVVTDAIGGDDFQATIFCIDRPQWKLIESLVKRDKVLYWVHPFHGGRHIKIVGSRQMSPRQYAVNQIYELQITAVEVDSDA